MRKAVAWACAGLLAAAGAEAAQWEAPWQNVWLNLRAHKVIAAMDETSFAGAVATYPGTKTDAEHYEVGVGRYLMWKIVGLFGSDQTVDAIRLSRFDERCETKTDEYGSVVLCALSAEVVVEEDGRSHAIPFETSRQVGAWMPPTEPYRRAVAAEVTMPVDAFIEQIGSELRAAGVL